LATFFEVGVALLEIRESRLYRADFATFEQYCLERWGFARARAYQLTEAALVTSRLSTVVDDAHLPQNESQIRPLAGLDPESQQTVWRKAVDTAPDGKVTQAHVRRTIEGMKLAPILVDDETGMPRAQIGTLHVEPGFSVRGKKDAQPDEKLLASVKQHGVVIPIVVREKRGRLCIIDGERRYRAARQLGIDTVPITHKGKANDTEALKMHLILNGGGPTGQIPHTTRERAALLGRIINAEDGLCERGEREI
jgi:hypothetical protein